MKVYQQRFIDLAVASEALTFGQFTLKSGRVSPYFFNAGRFSSGAALWQLGRCYADLLNDAGAEFDVLFGPAYKGIPLAAACACAMAADHGRDVPWGYNRKEAKDHGEGGTLVGADLTGRRVLVIDDVITAGTAVREVKALLDQAGATLAGVVIGLDRQERGRGMVSAIREVEQEFAVPVYSIIALEHIVAWLRDRGATAELAAVERYRSEYGV